MKKNFMKKAVAVTLSAAMAFSLSSVNMMTASAATVSIKKAMTLTAVTDKGTKLKLKNHNKKWKIYAVSSTKKAVCSTFGRKNTFVKLAPKAEGKTTIRIRVRNKVNKKTKLLKCKVTVVSNTVTPPGPDEPVPDNPVTDTSVSTQEQLEEALKISTLTSLSISSATATQFDIPDGAYGNIALTVDAPNAEINNHGKFKSITISQIKPSTWHEFATDNTITLTAQDASIVAEAGSRIADIICGRSGGTAKIIANGIVDKVTVNQKTNLTVSGTTEAAVPVDVKTEAAGSDIKADAKVAVTTSSNISVTANVAGCTVEVKNNTQEVSVAVTTAANVTVVVKDAKGNVLDTVPGGSTGRPVRIPAQVTTGDDGNKGDNNNNNTSTTTSKNPDKVSLENVGIATNGVTAVMQSVSGSSVSGCAVTVAFTGAGKITTSGGSLDTDIEYAYSVGNNSTEYGDLKTSYTTAANITVPDVNKTTTFDIVIYARAKAGKEKGGKSTEAGDVVTKTYTVTMDHDLHCSNPVEKK